MRVNLSTFVAAFCAENPIALVSSTTPSPVSSVVSSSAMVAASLLSSGADMLRLLPFVSTCTFTAVSTLPGSCSAHLAGLIAALIMMSHVSSISSQSKSLAAVCDNAFVFGPGHAKIGEKKLVKKITSGKFVELADLLFANVWVVNLELQSFLDGKGLVEGILTWTEACTVYQMVI